AQPATHVVDVALRPVATTPPVPVPVTRAASGGPVAAVPGATAATAAVTSAGPPATPARPALNPVPAPAPRDSVGGLATWYGAPVGTCASPVLAFGTLVTVTD